MVIKRLNSVSFVLARHPLRHGHAHNLLEGGTECAVTAEPTLIGQLLGNDRLTVGDGFTVEVDEMPDAQTVDVGIVGGALQGEVLTEIHAIGAY